MKKVLSKMILPGLLIIGLGYCVYMFYNRKVDESEINKNGFFCLGIVVDRMVTKGGVNHFTYKYNVKGHWYRYEDSVDDQFYSENKIGDTILVRFLRINPKISLIYKDQKYSRIVGAQPSEGWVKLPK